jgi:hypothetical protein
LHSFKGFIDAGGIQRVFEIANAGHRIDMLKYTFSHSNYMNFPSEIFDSVSISFDPTVRYTVWTMVIGGSFYATACSCVLQTQTQRYMCVKSTREAQK